MALRVLHLIDSGGLYGAERMLLALADEQARQGVVPLILSAGEHGVQEKPLEAEARRLGVPVTVWRMRPGLNLHQAWKILRWAREQGFQLLHSHGYKFNVLAGIWPRAIRRLPLVCTLHGYVRAPRWTRSALYESVDRALLRRVDRVVIVNQRMRADLPPSLAASAHCTFIANGIPSETPPVIPLPDDLAAWQRSHRVNLIAVGRLSPEKGFDRLVRIIGRHRHALSGIGLLIVGDGPQRSELERAIAEKDLSDMVRLGGYREDAAALLPHFDALVMPSLTEGLPITVLEALRARLPIFANAVGGLPAVLKAVPSARLLSVTDESAWAELLLDIAGTGVEAGDTAIGAAHFAAHYSASRMAAGYSCVYADLLDASV
ncbi:glycosyltransferase [Methylonatrum kenyense]|uniref:glycosyltransferase n=1 Tax=Methylonatrum kenyense TaxID=455253 RepID=UPI0020C08EA0|nr:glycosyltransferase [Methylonatrum kenyense]MCK8516815.1 glycosyltransferase [Methylonatrum kenyense]